MKQIPAIAASLMAVLVLAAPALAASPDQAFIIKAAQGGMAEVKAGQVALANGGADSKKFGAVMVKDHGNANTELGNLAKTLAVSLPNEVNDKQKAMLKKLKGLKGAAFDSAYLVAMKQAHADTIVLFETEIASGQDPAVKAWATKTLPTIRSHMAMDMQMLQTRGMINHM